MVELLDSLYHATREFLKYHGEVEVDKTFRLMLEAFRPFRSWEDIQLVNAFSLTLFMLPAYIHLFVRLYRTCSWYMGKYGPLFLGYDLLGLFLFVSFARSSRNLAMKTLIQVDTAWILAIFVFIWLLVRLIWQYGIRRKERGSESQDMKYYRVRYYITAGTWYVFSIILLIAGMRQPIYAENIEIMVRDVAVGGLLVAGIVLAISIVMVIYVRKRGKAIESREYVPLYFIIATMGMIVSRVLVNWQAIIRSDRGGIWDNEILMRKLFDIREGTTVVAYLLLLGIMTPVFLIWQQLRGDEQDKIIGNVKKIFPGSG